MPTPYGSRGGVAFGADELRVLGGALAIALQSGPTPEEAREYLRLAQAVDETVREGYRLRSFLLADLARYRDALPGAAVGYLDQLEAALTAGYLPRPDDLGALRSLSREAVSAAEADRRGALLQRCERLAERAVRARLRAIPGGRVPAPASAGDQDPEPEPAPEEPQEPAPAAPPPAPGRPVPTPAEVFPPRRPAPQPAEPPPPESPAEEEQDRVPA